MSTHPDTRLDELWTDLPVGTPPIDDIVRNGTARRRRHRLAAVGGTVALTFATIVGVSVGTNLSTPNRPGADNHLAGAPTTPAGTRLVGMNRVVVAVPEGWPTDPVVNQCGLPVEDGAWFARQVAPIDRCGSRHQVVSVMFSSLDSEAGRQAAHLATRSTTVNGTEVRTGEHECPATARCPDPDTLPAYIVVPSQGVAITLTAPPTERGVLDDIVASVQILGTDWTTVPFIDQGTFDDWQTTLNDHVLTPKFVRCGTPCGYTPDPDRVMSTDPAAGEVVAEGSTVTLYGPGAAPVVEPADPSPSVPKRLDCPGDQALATDGGLLVEGAPTSGAETPEQAVEEFLPQIGLAGHQYLVDRDVPEAWVLRPNGSAVARLDLLTGNGWTVHGYDRCLSKEGAVSVR